MQMLYAVESARSAKCTLCASWCILLSEHLRTVKSTVPGGDLELLSSSHPWIHPSDDENRYLHTVCSTSACKCNMHCRVHTTWLQHRGCCTACCCMYYFALLLYSVLEYQHSWIQCARMLHQLGIPDLRSVDLTSSGSDDPKMRCQTI